METLTNEEIRTLQLALDNMASDGMTDEGVKKLVALHVKLSAMLQRPTKDAADLVCTCRETYIAGVGKVVNATGCSKHQPSR